MDNIESAIILLLTKYNEAMNNNELDKAYLYKKEINKLRNIQKVMIISSITNEKSNPVLR